MNCLNNKSFLLGLFLLTGVGGIVLAEKKPDQGNEQPPTHGGGKEKNAAYTITERGAHYKVWERIEYEPGPEGKTFPRRHAYTELATGMHFKNALGEWEESEEKIEILPNDAGAVANKGPHKAIFPPEIKSGLIELQTPDQKWMRSRVWGLAYFDSASGESVLLAEVKESEGQLVGDNVILYPNAFTDFVADVRYTYTKAGFEQDVVLREQPPAPEVFNLNPKTTRLQVLTEFVEAPSPAKNRRSAGAKTDETLGFGEMEIGAGKAFSVDAAGGADGHTPVDKTWTPIEGRDFLIEEVHYEDVTDQLKKLPEAKKYDGASLRRRGRGENVLTGLKTMLPKRYARAVPGPKSQPRRMAKAELQKSPGFVLDYFTVTTQPNYTFTGEMTYYVSGTVNLSGTTTLEGGAVIKYLNSATANLTVSGPLVCKTDSYRPAVFTSKNDNSVGEKFSDSTGNPLSVPFYATALNLTGTYNSHVLENLRFGYFNIAVQFSGSYGATLTNRHLQFQTCATAIKCTSLTSAPLYVGNVLLANVSTGLESAYGVYALVENTTASQVYTFASFANTGYASLDVRNGIFENVATVANGGLTKTGDNNAFYNTTSFGTSPITLASQPFQSVGGGAYYLADNTCRNVGSLNLRAELLASLRKKTTYAPVAYTNVTFTVPAVFNPQAQRDTDTPDLGYHYDPLDYSFGGCHANSSITFTAGTAVGWFRTTSGYYHAGQGIHIADNQIGSFDGSAAAPCYWVRLNTVQENDRTAGYGTGGFTGWSSTPANVPDFRARFTRFSMMSYDGNHLRDDNHYLTVRAQDCEFYGGGVGGYGISMYFTNCLFFRSLLSQISGTGCEVVMRNCTMIGERLILTPISSANPTFKILDCAFDGTTFQFANSATSATYSQYNYNAYNNASYPFPISGTGNVPISGSFNWQTGPLGNFYLPTVSTLINQGSVAAPNIRLFHYTTQTTQAKETTSQVDIGYHYVATGVDPAGLVGYWPFDESTGTTANDLSGYGQNGTLFNGVTRTTGQVGAGALNFDGADDYVSATGSSALAVGQSGADFTVSYWLRLQVGNTGTWRGIMHKGSSDSERTFAMWMRPENNKLYYRITTTSGPDEGRDSAAAVALNQWVHVIYAKAGNKLRLYFNGVLDSEVTLAGTSVSNTGPLYLGKDPWYSGTNCRLDDVRVYARALTAGEILTLAVPFNTASDTDGDGVPDYLEDANGDGSPTGDATSWQSYNSPNQLTTGNGLRVFTPLK